MSGGLHSTIANEPMIDALYPYSRFRNLVLYLTKPKDFAKPIDRMKSSAVSVLNFPRLHP